MNCWKASVLIKLIPTFIICLSPDGDWIRENGYLDVSLFCKGKLHHCQSKEKSVFSKKKIQMQKTSRKDNHFLTLMISNLYHPNQTQMQANKITRGSLMYHRGIITPTQLLLPLKHLFHSNNFSTLAG